MPGRRNGKKAPRRGTKRASKRRSSTDGQMSARGIGATALGAAGAYTFGLPVAAAGIGGLGLYKAKNDLQDWYVDRFSNWEDDDIPTGTGFKCPGCDEIIDCSARRSCGLLKQKVDKEFSVVFCAKCRTVIGTFSSS